MINTTPIPASSLESSIGELVAVIRARADADRSQLSNSRATMIALGEGLYRLRQRPDVDRTAYGRLVSPWVNIKRAGRAVRMYLESIGARTKPEHKAEQNPACRANGLHDGSVVPNVNPACQTPAQSLSQDDLEDLLGCTPVPPSVVVDEPQGGEGGFEDEFEGEDEFEISNLKFESGDPLRLADSAPPPPPPRTEEEKKAPSIGPQLTLASLYEQAQTVGTEFMRVIESGLDEAVKARLVADVRGLVAAAMNSGTGSESRATTGGV